MLRQRPYYGPRVVMRRPWVTLKVPIWSSEKSEFATLLYTFFSATVFAKFLGYQKNLQNFS